MVVSNYCDVTGMEPFCQPWVVRGEK